jgi:hypothetical protein
MDSVESSKKRDEETNTLFHEATNSKRLLQYLVEKGLINYAVGLSIPFF